MSHTRKSIAIALVTLCFLVPHASYAATVDLQIQINQLLALVAQLQAQLAAMRVAHGGEKVRPDSSSFSEKKALDFIAAQYDPAQQLVREYPGSTTFWLWSDNLLAQAVLRHNNARLSRAIESKMDSYRVAMQSPWAVLDPEHFENTSFRGGSERNASGVNIRYSDYSSGGELSCDDYADIAFLKAIYFYKMGNLNGAKECYNAGKRTWDGTGMKDAGNISGDYAVYKVALGLLAQKITGFSSIGIPDDYFDRFQAANGGITTDIVNGQPSGTQNVETTAAVLVAKDIRLLDDPTKQVATQKPQATTQTNTPLSPSTGTSAGTTPQPSASNSPTSYVYDVQDDLRHNFGREDSGDWSAATAYDAEGTMLFGPYAKDWSGSKAEVTFSLMVDNNTADDLPVVNIDLYDATAGEILALKQIKRKSFGSTFSYQDFSLSASLAGRAGHEMETRVYWFDVSYVRVGDVRVRLTP